MVAPSEVHAPPPTPSLWRHRDFRWLFAGSTVSRFGSEISELALPLLVILTLDATETQVGLVRAAQYLPFLLVTLHAGVLVDRVRRRPLMITADLARSVVSPAPLPATAPPGGTGSARRCSSRWPSATVRRCCCSSCPVRDPPRWCFSARSSPSRGSARRWPMSTMSAFARAWSPTACRVGSWRRTASCRGVRSRSVR
jgi:MFS family permease